MEGLYGWQFYRELCEKIDNKHKVLFSKSQKLKYAAAKRRHAKKEIFEDWNDAVNEILEIWNEALA